ncbi:MAG: DUF350 domain-containing protein [Proteobacteria bacterium]|nr:DUF350 domain-containing protein [Pseudomonadota bacterium]
MSMNIQSLAEELVSLEGIETLSYLPNLLLVLLILLLMWVGKKIFDLFTSYSIEYQLVKADNKAITIAFVGYLSGVAIILEGVAQGESESLPTALLDVGIWGIIGILLLNLAGKINDRLLLRRFDNKEELLERHNVGVGVVVAGSYLGSAMIIRSIVLGESLGWAFDITLTLFYFILGQIAFFIYCILYQKVIKYDFHKEIQEGNVAAGISLGFNLLAIGFLLAIPLRTSFSLLFFAAWFILGSAVMAFFRFVMDRIIIPMEKLDEEIHKDKNWGVAFLESCFSIAAVIILQSIFT